MIAQAAMVPTDTAVNVSIVGAGALLISRVLSAPQQLIEPVEVIAQAA